MHCYLLGSLSIGALGIVGYTLLPNESAEFRDLTRDTKALLEEVANSYEPPGLSRSLIPLKDVLAIYVNSRGNRDWANHLRAETGSPEYTILLNQLEEDHRLIKRLALACVGDKLLDKLAPNCHSTRHERLLWTYADEQGVLDQLAEFCPIRDREFISTRV